MLELRWLKFWGCSETVNKLFSRKAAKQHTQSDRGTMKLQKCTQDVKNSKEKRSVVVQVRFYSDTEIQWKLLGRPSGCQTNYFIRDNTLLSFTSPVAASKRLTSPTPSRTKPRWKTWGSQKLYCEGLVDASLSESRIWPYVTACEESRGQSSSHAW